MLFCFIGFALLIEAVHQYATPSGSEVDGQFQLLPRCDPVGVGGGRLAKMQPCWSQGWATYQDATLLESGLGDLPRCDCVGVVQLDLQLSNLR